MIPLAFNASEKLFVIVSAFNAPGPRPLFLLAELIKKLVPLADTIARESQQSIFRTRTGEALSRQVKPDMNILAAADELGLGNQLLPSHFSTNGTYRALEQGMKSVPASRLEAQEEKVITELQRQADDLITRYGGTTDKSALSESFKEQSIKTTKELNDQSDALYEKVNKAIPPRNTRFNRERFLSIES